MSKPTLLIDGDQFLYKACIAVEQEVRWDEENHVLFSNEEDALRTALAGIRNVMEALSSDKVRLAFTKGESFRKALYPPYKSNRATVRKPMCFVEVRERLEAEFPSLSIDGLEADDILGIWATRDKGDYIIVSDDKDLRTIPGKLYRQGQLETITLTDADYQWMFQTLIGDTADGYPGCPGVGPKTAEKLLNAVTDRFGTIRSLSPLLAWDTVLHAYDKAGLSPEDALIQARCARILRAEDWDSPNKKVKLWTPQSDSTTS